MIKISTTSEFQNKDVKNEAAVSPEATDIWKKFLDLLAQSLKEMEIETWFSILKPKAYENNTLTLLVPSKDYYSIIERRFNTQIGKIIDSGLLGEDGRLIYEVEEPAAEEEVKATSPAVHDIQKPYTKPENKINTKDREFKEPFNSNLYSKFYFENFVRGESNELAVAVAYAITQNPGNLYNPFFIYGGVGIGKTHLIQSIGNEIVKNYPDKRVYYTTAPDFTTQFTSSIAKDRVDFSSGVLGTKKLDAFYKSLDVLILDDVQNLAGKQGTQDFIYQIFNTLYNNRKHIIFSCDKPISQIKDIEERLVSRFKCGMIADIQPPSWEMRVAIIKKKLEELDAVFPEDVIHYIASNVKDSIRTIESCISGILTESKFLFKNRIDIDIAEKTIVRTVGTSRRQKNISIENIIYTVAQYYNVSENGILSKKRTKEVAFARQVAMYLAKEMTNLTLESIGLNFGGKDHATVLYSHNTIRQILKKDSNLQNQIKDIKEQINTL